MDLYPKNLEELEQKFSTEEACRNYLIKLRWPEGFRCPVCEHDGVWHLQKGLLKCAKCGWKTSVTIFEGTRKPLISWFRVIWWVVSQKMAQVP
jgi:transcription elongation factor Elf1